VRKNPLRNNNWQWVLLPPLELMINPLGGTFLIAFLPKKYCFCVYEQFVFEWLLAPAT